MESFNGRFRDECLNAHLFGSLSAARRIIEAWRIDYNTQRPHTSLTLSTAPTATLHAATKSYVDTGEAARLPLTGGTLTGALTVQGNVTATRSVTLGLDLDRGAARGVIGGDAEQRADKDALAGGHGMATTSARWSR